jgi:peptide/nickel transport system substrate-binding protein
MRRSVLALFAASSLLILATAHAATRPRYGGTLRVALRAAPVSLDPADANQASSLTGRNLSSLLFDTLVTLDDSGRPQPALATSWRTEPGDQRWQFQLRHGVTFSDGMPLTSDAVAASLRVSNPDWKIFSAGDAVVIERDSAVPNLLAELALGRNGIARRGGARPIGTGAFTVTQWDPGKVLTLAAREDYWAGRPFLDAIEINLGRNFRDQTVTLDLGKADLIEIAPEQARRAAAEGRHIESSAPSELVALIFASDRQTPEEGRLRSALAISIDRNSLNNVLLQGGGEPAGGLLPNWLSGYAFLFPTNTDPVKANQTRGELKQAKPWTLSYDTADPVARLMADRIALNAHDVNLTVQPVSSPTADIRLARISLSGADTRLALSELAASIGLPPASARGNTASVEELYASESMFLQSQRVIPLLHLRVSYGLSGSVRNWNAGLDGSWRLQDVWLGAEK